ncbi:MAG TPA: DUF2314 domain-containing protein [Mucilaginibacter sp.]|nr:DUF2314 domain-containing protein [Mucilaginibacter sp.]
MKKTLIALFFITTCYSIAHSQTVRKNNIEYSSVKLSKDDKIFLALKDTAQKHMQEFIQSLNKHGHDVRNYEFHVKSDFVQNGNHEHMWSRVYEYQNGVFKGIFIDSAFTVKNVKMGDKVTIKKNEVEDWSIHDELTNKTIGQFSIRYLDSKKKQK